MEQNFIVERRTNSQEGELRTCGVASWEGTRRRLADPADLAWSFRSFPCSSIGFHRSRHCKWQSGSCEAPFSPWVLKLARTCGSRQTLRFPSSQACHDIS